MGLLDECYECGISGHNRARGKIYRINPQNGTISTTYGDMGSVNAYDLRLGITETADGGYAAVSSRRNAIDFPDLGALGVYSTCPGYANIASATVNPWAGAPDGWGVWDTDPLICKFDNADNLEWEWSEDVNPGRGRVLPPGDFKR